MMMADSPDALSVAFRAVSFVLLLNASGLSIFIAAFGHLVPDTVAVVAKLGWKLAVGALVFVVVNQALEAARMAGEMSGVVDPAMQKMALLSSAGAAFAVRIVGLVLVAVGLARTARRQHGAPMLAASPGMSSAARASPPTGMSVRDMPADVADSSAPSAGASQSGSLGLALLGTLLSVTAFTLAGHTSVTPHRLAAGALLTLHLLMVAFWLGALWPLYIAAKKEPPQVVARVIDAFSAAATWMVPIILLAGIGLAALLLPNLAAFRQPYGELLLAKIAGFAVLMAMASLNKWSFGPACAAGETTAFKRTVLTEYALICAVLAITAVMTTFYSPGVA